eukprot:522315-Pyramimonas_sp.AAC.1
MKRLTEVATRAEGSTLARRRQGAMCGNHAMQRHRRSAISRLPSPAQLESSWPRTSRACSAPDS